MPLNRDDMLKDLHESRQIYEDSLKNRSALRQSWKRRGYKFMTQRGAIWKKYRSI